ncbi:MAG: DUF3810 domain-containing protein [Flavobacterium sp.]|nr:DUF3810 domain-containing protein [Flavobacterium sp.]
MKKKYYLPLGLLIQIVLVQLISFFPEFIEGFYSNGLYTSISYFSRIIFGFIPFSIGDFGYLFAIVFLIIGYTKNRKIIKLSWKDRLLKILSYFSVFYFFFNILWGLNYYRVPLFEKLKIEKEYSNEDLLKFTKLLIAKTNSIHSQITQNDSLKVVFPYSQEQVFEMNLKGYQSLSKQIPSLNYDHPSIKKSLFSLPLSYMGFSGYLNPFTNEAQVNDKIPMYNFPTTLTHEMAHQLGYASESEANFIGFLASINNENIYFQYSGYNHALHYCLSNWKFNDEVQFKKLLKTVHPGIIKNYKESEDFWNKYESFVEKGFHLFYDRFLKMNQQKDGIDGYSRFVDLLVNYYKNENL